jgi:branched-chain amino acid transport system permease protein
VSKPVTPQFFFVQLLNGLSFGALLFFLASGFTLIFGLMRIVNLSHGAYYLFGGYVGLVTARATSNFGLAVLAGIVAVALVGFLTERVLLRLIRGQELSEVLLTVGVAFIIADLCLAFFGGNPESVPQPGLLRGALSLGVISYPRYRVFIAVCAVVVGVGLYLLMERTRLGAIVRAGVDDRETIAALGVDINRVFTGVFLLGAALAGLAGVMGGALLPLLPGGDAEILLLSLVVVVIGGLGSLKGAALGSALVGLINTFGIALIPDLSYFVLFAPMALILMLRPSGLFGRA